MESNEVSRGRPHGDEPRVCPLPDRRSKGSERSRDPAARRANGTEGYSDYGHAREGDMEVTDDEVAGVIDLFGALTPAELRRAIVELAFKRGEDPPEIPVEAAVSEYRLVRIGPDAEASGGERLDEGETTGDDATGDDESKSEAPDVEVSLLVPGPAAFPTLPAGAEDLPHILAIEPRTIDRDALATRIEERFRADAARAVVEGDDERIATLLDASYDIESWAAVDLGDARERLDAASASTSTSAPSDS